MKRIALILMAIAVAAPGLSIAGEGHGMKKGHGVTFKQADGDGDGSVTWDEFKGAHEASLKMKFENWDKDKSGGLSRDEYVKGKRKMMGGMAKKKKMKKEMMKEDGPMEMEAEEMPADSAE